MMRRLIELAARKRRRVVGLMSGTSVDGIDAVVVELTGSGVDTRQEILVFDTIALDLLISSSPCQKTNTPINSISTASGANSE